MDGSDENNGRASSIKENAGIADESKRPREPGAVGEGGPEKVDGVNGDCSSILGGLLSGTG